MVEAPEAALGAVVAALIAGIVSLLGLIISKEQKTSEFRQNWIDALRSDLTSFLTQINAIRDAVGVKYEDYADKVQALRPLYIKLNYSTFDILLRVNKNETKTRKLLDAMEAFNKLTADDTKLLAEDMRVVEREFLDASQALLKYEWRRVKSGERTFRIAKLVAMIVILISAVVGSAVAYRAWQLDRGEPFQATASQISCLVGIGSVPGSVSVHSSKTVGTK